MYVNILLEYQELIFKYISSGLAFDKLEPLLWDEIGKFEYIMNTECLFLLSKDNNECSNGKHTFIDENNLKHNTIMANYKDELLFTRYKEG